MARNFLQTHVALMALAAASVADTRSPPLAQPDASDAPVPTPPAAPDPFVEAKSRAERRRIARAAAKQHRKLAKQAKRMKQRGDNG